MTAEQSALMSKAKGSLEAAQLLASQGFPDFAASRAYYTMFYVAKALLLGEGLTFSKHSAVIASFGQRFSKTGRVPPEYHKYLLDGQESRLAGDYEAEGGVAQGEAAEHIRRAERFLDLAQRLLGQVPPPATA